MKKVNNSKTPKPLFRRVLIALAVTTALILIAWFLLPKPNYAEEVARPLENALIEAGAVQKCIRGDDGRGLDNNVPWHQGYFEFSANEERSVDVINKIAADNGYRLVRASPSNKGHINSVDDKYIQNWFFDNTSKKNPYSDLEAGSIELAITVNAHGADQVCGASAPITVDATHSVVSVDVKLPQFKR